MSHAKHSKFRAKQMNTILKCNRHLKNANVHRARAQSALKNILSKCDLQEKSKETDY